MSNIESTADSWPRARSPESRTAIRLAIVGGFLGSGKTATLLRLAQMHVVEGRKVSVITNDQAAGLVDTERFRAIGVPAGEVSGGCFCCRFDDFVAQAEGLIAQTQPDLILAEPTGSCTDIVATVMHPLGRFHGQHFTLAPFIVLVDPRRVLTVLAGEGPVRISEKIAYIFRLQQLEADAIAINKVDLLSSAERKRVREIIARHFPDTPTLTISAETGEGFTELVAAMEAPRSAVNRALREIDYDRYAEGEAELGWLNRVVQLRAGKAADLDTALIELARDIQRSLREAGIEVAHAKLLLRGAGGPAVVSIVGNELPVHLARAADEASRQLELLLNLRAVGGPETVALLVADIVTAWRERRQLELRGDIGQAFAPPRPTPTHRMAVI
jgi:G3E family GTPase